MKYLSAWLWLCLGLALSGCGSPSDKTSRRELESRENLMKVYGELAGVYQGKITPVEPRDLSYPVELRLDVVEVQDGVNENREVRFRPELRGVFRMMGEATDSTRVQMNVRFYKETNEIAMQSSGNSPGGGAAYFISISGVVEPGLIRGRSTDNIGRTGVAEFKRVR